jgi:hypothetical protein
MTEPLRRARRALGAIVFLVLWGLITHGTYAGTGDEPHYMMIARSLVSDGDLDLADDYADPAGLIRLGDLPPENHARRGREGILRPVHDVGMPAFFAPWFAVSYRIARDAAPFVPATWMRRARLNQWLVLRHLLSFGMMALTVALVLQLFDAFVELSGDRRLSFLGALLAGLSPPLLTHSYLFFTEVLSALVAWTAYRMILAEREDAGWRFRAGLLTGFLLLVHVRNAGLVLGLAFVAASAWRGPRRSHAAWALGGLAVPVLVRTWVNAAFWGTAIGSPHARAEWSAGIAAATAESVSRLGGLLVDQEHGLLPYAPIYLLVAAGWLALRRRASGAATLAIVVTAYLVPVLCPWTNVHGWRGGWSPAARMLVPIAPFLAVAAFGALMRGSRIPALMLALLQVAIDQLLWRDPRLAWNEGDGYAEFADAFFPGTAGWLPAWRAGGGVLTTMAFLAAWWGLAALAQMRPALRAARPEK